MLGFAPELIGWFILLVDYWFFWLPQKMFGISPELISWCFAGLVPFIFIVFWPFLTVLWLMFVAWFFYHQYYNVKYLQPSDKVILITGCDSGFGQAVAVELDLKGCHVFAGCLYPDGQGAQLLRAQTSDRLQVVDLDVTNEAKVGACARKIEEYCEEKGFKGLWGVYNNAGIAMSGEVDWVPLADYQRSMDINLWGHVRVTKSVLHLIRQAKGRVVTVTSGIARAVNPGRSPYCIPKAALEAFMDCLRYEMKKFGVKCITITPGNLSSQTPVFAHMGAFMDGLFERMGASTRRVYGRKYLEAFKHRVCNAYTAPSSSVTVEQVVDAVVQALLTVHPRTHYAPAQLSWILWWPVFYLLPAELTDPLQGHWNPMPPAAGLDTQ